LSQEQLQGAGDDRGLPRAAKHGTGLAGQTETVFAWEEIY